MDVKEYLNLHSQDLARVVLSKGVRPLKESQSVGPEEELLLLKVRESKGDIGHVGKEKRVRRT